jgi:hypothetical protein
MYIHVYIYMYTCVRARELFKEFKEFSFYAVITS